MFHNEYTGFNSKLVPRSKKLRLEMTRQERHLWYDYLRNYPVKFCRQRPIACYIADFYCHQAKLVIELDGSQHYTEEGKSYDDARTEIINQYGIEVIRFSNPDVDRNFRGVCDQIERRVKERIKSKVSIDY